MFTGLFRLGHFSPSTLLNIQPDISVHAKLLTGGLLPLCTTLASNSIYESFLGDTKAEALLHGHSYTAHAVGCEVARVSLEEMLALDRSGKWQTYKNDWSARSSVAKLAEGVKGRDQASPELWSMWSESFVSNISHKAEVDSVIALGSVLAITLNDSEGAGYSSDAAVGVQKKLLETKGEADFNVHSRVLGNVIYFMASMVSEPKSLRSIEERLMKVVGFS